MRSRFVRRFFLASVCLVAAGTAWPEEALPSEVSDRPGAVRTSEKGVPDSIGPFRLADADSSAWLRFQFVGQLCMDFQSVNQGQDEDRSNTLIMKARRIRPIISVSLPEQRLSLRVHLSAAPGSLELMDLYFNYKAHEQLQLRAGQYKAPFTRYRIQSFQRLTFVDWPIVARAFGGERQMGLALHNGYERPPRYGYAFGVFTGVNARASHAAYLPKVYGEKIPNPSDLADPGPAAEFHPELFLHLAYNARGVRVQSDTDEVGGGLRYAAMLSAAWDLDPTPHQDFKLRLSPEFLAKYQGLSLSTIGYVGIVEMGVPARTEQAMLGGLLQTAYRINDSYEISALYAVVDLSDALVDDAYGPSSNEIAASSQNDAQVVREEEIRVGFNRYIASHALKWQTDGGWLTHRGRHEDRTDFVVRSQFQLAF